MGNARWAARPWSGRQREEKKRREQQRRELEALLALGVL